MISLKMEQLVKTFGDVRALDHVDLQINAGELFFLLGPSGCGKTTLLRALAGFCEVDSGRILFGNEDVTRLAPHLREAGMVFQSYALWPHLTVAGNVAFGLEERRVKAGEINRRVTEALEQVQMSAFADRKIGQLSGGQQQRVALARALVIRPRCLLLDEPLSNLDAKLRLEMRGEIRRLCKEHGLTAVYVTHDQKEALSVGDRIAIMAKGKVLQVGTPAEIYRRPVSRTVAEFIGEGNGFSGKIQSVENGKARVKTDCGDFEGIISPIGWSPHINESVWISIRPEAWQKSSEAKALNSISGTLASSIYLGDVAQHRIRCQHREVSVSEINPNAMTAVTPSEVCYWVQTEDVVVMKTSDES